MRSWLAPAGFLGWAGVCVAASGATHVTACHPCGAALGQIRFDRGAYYGWAWERSGGTLEIKGVVPKSSGNAAGLAGTAPVEPCPPNAEAIAYLKAVVDPGRRETTFRNIRPDGHQGRPAAASECVYDYDDDECHDE